MNEIVEKGVKLVPDVYKFENVLFVALFEIHVIGCGVDEILGSVQSENIRKNLFIHFDVGLFYKIGEF